MTKDYKEANNKDTASGGYGWMLSGIAMGLLVGLSMYFYANYQESLAANKNANAGVAQDANVPFGEDGLPANSDAAIGIQEPDPISVVIENARHEQQDRKRASFSYYAVLPNLELDVNVKPSENDTKVNTKVNTQVETEATEKVILKPGTYVLQIASFKSEAQARRAQKKLTAQGLETRIEKRKVKGKNWFRLFAGPTGTQDDLNAWNAVVVKAGFKPLVVTVR